MTPKQAAAYCRTLTSTLSTIGTQATCHLHQGEDRPEDDDDAGWEALTAASNQILDEHRLQYGDLNMGYREAEVAIKELSARVAQCLADETEVAPADLEQLQQFGRLMEKRPPCEDRGWFEAEVQTVPLSDKSWLTQLLASIGVSVRLPSTSAHLRVSHIQLHADASETPDLGMVARVCVRFQAYMNGRQGDSLLDMLKLARVRLALPNRGPMEVQVESIARIEEPEVALA